MSKKVIKKPWGSEVIVEHNEHYVIKYLRIEAGKKLSLQYHEIKHETLMVEQGEGIIQINDVLYDVAEGDKFVIEPKTIHRIGASDKTNLIILEVSTPQLDDVVRISDDYGRVEK